jgi:hypothetical protein
VRCVHGVHGGVLAGEHREDEQAAAVLCGVPQERLRALVGAARARRIVNGALVLITLGGNDFMTNYYLVPFSLRSQQFALPDYVRFLISEYKKILQVC